MKRLLSFFSIVLFSLGWVNAQDMATINFTLDPSDDSGVNTKMTIPKLEATAEWKVTATTVYEGEATGQWGSRLFSIQNEATSSLAGFEFYIRPQDYNGATAGQIGVNNSYGRLNTTPFDIPIGGLLMTFEITSDGTGTIRAKVTVGDKTLYEDPEDEPGVLTKVDPPVMDYVQAAQKYPVDVTIEYYPTYLDVSPDQLDFGTILYEEGVEVGPKVVRITGSSASTEKFTYELVGVSGDLTAFYVDPSGEFEFNENTGGEIGIYFAPEEMGESKTSLTVTRGNVTQTVELTGTALAKTPVIVSPAIGDPNADAEGNVWYRIQFPDRTTNVLTDAGKDLPLEATRADKNNENQLWKFVDTDGNENKFKIISKNGREIGYKDPVIEEETEVEPGLFIAVESSSNTYNFYLRTDVQWQIFWNEYEPEEATPNTSAYINKTNNSDYFTAYYVSDTELDNGNAMQFHLYSQNIIPDFPEFSTSEKDIWYYIQFERSAGTNKVWEELEEIDEVLLTNIIQSENRQETSQQWKLIEEMDGFKIVSYTGNALVLNTETEKIESISNVAGADKFKFVDWYYNDKTYKLQIENADQNVSQGDTYRYLNDFGGSGTSLSLWSLNNAGNFLTFIPVDSRGIEDLDIDGDNEGTDPVIATQYYTIQGTLLGSKPGVQGIYIEKKIRQSQKISARKIFISGK